MREDWRRRYDIELRWMCNSADLPSALRPAYMWYVVVDYHENVQSRATFDTQVQAQAWLQSGAPDEPDAWTNIYWNAA